MVMPLFGRKKKDELENSKGSAYPVQGAPQVVATAPIRNPGPPGYLQYQQGPPPPYYAAPPGYAQQPQIHPQYAQQPYAQQQYGQYHGYPQGGYMQQPQTVVVTGGFEAGARFGPGGAGASIPPPPPGCAPNAAQIAQAQGHNVVVTQKASSFLEGGGDGGMVIW